MAKNQTSSINSVRASRDGHEYHEAWTARKALQLLLPTDNFVGLAVEGLSPADQAGAISATVEIADTTLYYGKSTKFEKADSISIVQFKYSVSNRDNELCATHARETIAKFAATYLDYKRRYRAREVQERLQFELITNRPIYPAFLQAIANIAERKPLFGDIKKQTEQFKAVCGFDGKVLVEFAGKCLITGLAGSLSDTKRDLSRTLVDWSATSDAVAESFFHSLKTEWTADIIYRTRSDVRGDVIQYIEMFYNSNRLHSYLGYKNPNDFENNFILANAA